MVQFVASHAVLVAGEAMRKYSAREVLISESI